MEHHGQQASEEEERWRKFSRARVALNGPTTISAGMAAEQSLSKAPLRHQPWRRE
jgi:hypothetical protein